MLRDYQQKISDDIDVELDRGKRSILIQCPTGGGKTHLISHRAKLANGPTVDQAHRQELVYQISMAMARDGIEHRILAQTSTCNYIVDRQIVDSQIVHCIFPFQKNRFISHPDYRFVVDGLFFCCVV